MKRKVLVGLGINVFLLVLMNLSAIAGVNLPWETPLGNLQASLTGPVAFAIAVGAIMVTGGMLIFGGELNEVAKRSFYVVLVLGLLVAAQNTLAIFFPAAVGGGAVI